MHPNCEIDVVMEFMFVDCMFEFFQSTWILDKFCKRILHMNLSTDE